MTSILADSIAAIERGEILDDAAMTESLAAMMHEDADQTQTMHFLAALADRRETGGETVGEIAAAARYVRSLAAPIDAAPGTIDCCGTGGDGLHTFNVSTAVALVAAACGARVAKHGNRASSSKSGAADVLEALGAPLTLPRETLERALREIGFCFLMAPAHHAAMRHVAAARKTLGRRTIFNLIGPLANPAGASRQLVGVYARHWVRPMAEALKELGTEKAMVVHGGDGLDEISITTLTAAATLENGYIEERTFSPDDFALPRGRMEDLRGGDAATNASALLTLLEGSRSAYRDIVLANTAGALYLHDGRDFKTGVRDAAAAIDTGAARQILERYKALG